MRSFLAIVGLVFLAVAILVGGSIRSDIQLQIVVTSLAAMFILLGVVSVLGKLAKIEAQISRSVSVDQTLRDAAIKDRCRPYIKVRKPAFSNGRIYMCDVNGQKANLDTEAEALAFVMSHLDAPAVLPNAAT